MSLLKQKRKTSYQQNVAIALIQRKNRKNALESELPICNAFISLSADPPKKYVP
jgi:hypothetical protein